MVRDQAPCELREMIVEADEIFFELVDEFLKLKFGDEKEELESVISYDGEHAL